MHRLRQCLPYFEENGWKATVLSVNPEYVEQGKDDLLLQTLPDDLDHISCGALPASLTRKFGLGNLGIRAYPFLYRRLVAYLKYNQVDLVFFSTTVFVSIALGKMIKRRFGIPFVVDMQDPWRNDYYLTIPRGDRPAKFWFNYRLQAFLEARTMPHCDGLIAVSKGYISELVDRYPELEDRPSEAIPFSVLRKDFEVSANLMWDRFALDAINIVYVGRGGKDLQQAMEIVFSGFAELLGQQGQSSKAGRIHFSFLGTSYAPNGQGVQTIKPVAHKYGVGGYVTEQTDRLGYFEALAALASADILLVPDSEDKHYTASKLYPYILSRKPLIAVAHENSPMVPLLTSLNAGEMVLYKDGDAREDVSEKFCESLGSIILKIPFMPECDWREFERYEAGAMTNRVCRVFEQVLEKQEKNNVFTS